MMRRFLLRICSFSLFVAVLAVASRGTNQWLLRFQGPVWKDVPHTLVLGDSHVRVAIDPSMLPGARNVAQDAEPMMVTYLKMRRLLDVSPGVSTVVVGFGPHSLAPFNDAKFVSPDVAPEMGRRYYGLGPWWRISGIPLSLPCILTAETRYLWTPNRELVRNLLLGLGGRPVPDPPFVGWYEALQGSNLTEESLEAVKTRHFGVDTISPPPSQVQEASLRRIVALARGRGLRVILVSTPTHPRYRESVPQSIRARFDQVWRELIRQPCVSGLDQSTWELSDGEYGDFDHVSATGAARVSAEVARHLEVRVR